MYQFFASLRSFTRTPTWWPRQPAKGEAGFFAGSLKSLMIVLLF